MLSRKKILIIVIAIIVTFIAAFGLYKILDNPDPYVTQSAPQLPDPPLKELAERKGVQVGSFASLKYLRERAYTDILA